MYTEKALGMIEIFGRTGAVEALDAALKAANVELVSMVRVGGGITTIFFEGDVASCKASCEAGGAAADRISKVLSVHVIPRPDPSVRALLDQDRSGYYEGGNFPYYDPDNYDRKVQQEAEEDEPVPEKTQAEAETAVPEKLSSMTVNALRRLARETPDYPLSRQEIKFAKKEELLAYFRKMHE